MKIDKDLNRYFYKEDIKQQISTIKACSTSLVIKKMQIKTPVSHHFTHIRTHVVEI